MRDDLTESLEGHIRGNADAAKRLLPAVYKELRALAGHYMKSEQPGHTLQPTALVHEAWIRLVDAHRIDWQGRTHFFAVAALEMRRVLVDHARRRDADKRGGAVRRVTLAEDVAMTANRVVDVLALHQALEHLAERNGRRARVAELRIFGGLQIGEIAGVLEISERTAKEDWRMARALIARELGRDTPE